jgi:predicted nucleotidyltransferase
MSPTEASALDAAVRRIVEGFHPQRIILFGSLATGQSGPDSDADLLVVMSVEGSKRKVAVQIDLALKGIDLPMDILVVTPEDLQRQQDRVGSIIRTALKEGKVLYEQAA